MTSMKASKVVGNLWPASSACSRFECPNQTDMASAKFSLTPKFDSSWGHFGMLAPLFPICFFYTIFGDLKGHQEISTLSRDLRSIFPIRSAPSTPLLLARVGRKHSLRLPCPD